MMAFALGKDLHRAVAQVAGPPADPEGESLVGGRASEEDTLHPPGDDYADPG
jgi:hypothetical protein